MIDQRVVVITGASGDLGGATARRYAAAGDHVWIGYNEGADRARTLVEEIRGGGHVADAVKLDLTERRSVEMGLQTVLDRLGRIDVLVNNAAIRPAGSLIDVDDDAWQAVLGVNLLGAVRCSRFVLTGMAERRFGRIINISGTDAYWGWGDGPHVTVSKAGLLGLTRAIAAEFARAGITANSLIPGPFDTPRKSALNGDWSETRRYVMDRIPLGREGRPEELAEWCWFLSTDAAAFVTGQDIHINGGAFPLVRSPNISR